MPRQGSLASCFQGPDDGGQVPSPWSKHVERPPETSSSFLLCVSLGLPVQTFLKPHPSPSCLVVMCHSVRDIVCRFGLLLGQRHSVLQLLT